jgi:predicted amidohydrolase
MTATKFVVGLVQTNPGDDRDVNIARAIDGIQKSASAGAALVVLPEYVTYLHASGNAMRANAPTSETEILEHFKRAARANQVWVLVGSLVLSTGGAKLLNRSFLITSAGETVATYDKIHMFDATLPGGRVIRESSAYESGDRAVVVGTPWARLGMSICYDVRFPALYRSLAKAGAELLMIPSAFTKATGTMHWQALLQARAIENGAYVIAPGTCGTHPGGHETYGHSLVVDPMGQIIAAAGEDPAVICAEIDTALVAKARQKIPSLTHDRPFTIEQAGAVHAALNQEQA